MDSTEKQELEESRRKAKAKLQALATWERWVACTSVFWITLWLVGVAGSQMTESFKSATDYGFNEVGDLIAGIFAPLAFAWLVVSYRQQAAALEMNSSDLALSVLEWKEQNSTSKRIADATQWESAPIIAAGRVLLNKPDKPQIELTNVGSSAIVATVWHRGFSSSVDGQRGSGEFLIRRGVWQKGLRLEIPARLEDHSGAAIKQLLLVSKQAAQKHVVTAAKDSPLPEDRAVMYDLFVNVMGGTGANYWYRARGRLECRIVALTSDGRWIGEAGSVRGERFESFRVEEAVVQELLGHLPPIEGRDYDGWAHLPTLLETEPDTGN